MGTRSLKKLEGKKYATGSKSQVATAKIMNAFHKEVVRQILLGNRVILPGGITIEIIKHVHEATRTGLVKKQPRFGFNYKVRLTYDKLKVKKVKFTAAPSLEKKLMAVLKETDFEYKLVDYGYQ
jgi:hypothetical protein